MQAGLNTVNLSQMNTFQQWLLWMHILGGSAIFVSIFVIHVRKKAFENRFGAILKEQHEQRRKRRSSFRDTTGRSFSARRSLSLSRPRSQGIGMGELTKKPSLGQPQNSNGSTGDGLRIDKGTLGDPARDAETAIESPTPNGAIENPRTSHGEAKYSNKTEQTGANLHETSADHIAFVPSTYFNPNNNMAQASQIKHRNSAFSFTGVGASPVRTSFHRPFFAEMNERQPTRLAGVGLMDDPATPWHIGNLIRKEVVGRNSQFHGLTHEEREQLGGVEYRAIQLLSWVVPLYFVLWQLLGCLAVGAWMNNYAFDITEANGINAWWVFSFHVSP